LHDHSPAKWKKPVVPVKVEDSSWGKAIEASDTEAKLELLDAHQHDPNHAATNGLGVAGLGTD